MATLSGLWPLRSSAVVSCPIPVSYPADCGPVSVMFSTDHPSSSAWDDPPTEIRLYYDASTGSYTSKTMILVSNTIDDQELFTTNHLISGAADESVDDRTHIARLGSLLRAEYVLPSASESQPVYASVPARARLVSLQPVAFTNDSVVPNDEVIFGHLFAMRESLAQIGIEARWHSPVYTSIPTGVSFEDGLTMIENVGLDTVQITAETRRLIETRGTHPNTSDVHVFFVRKLKWTAEGSTKRGAQLRPGLDGLAKEHLGYTYNVFLNWQDDATHTAGPFSLAHELVQLLSDNGGHSTNSWSLMLSATSFTNESIGNTKRVETNWFDAVWTNHQGHLLED